MTYKKYPRDSKCVKCNGKHCCQSLPGSYSPEDILKIFGSIEKAIESGIVAIDFWEGSPDLYFMRPRAKNALGVLYDASWGGVCMHFSSGVGCSLKREERPLGCKIVNPNDACSIDGRGNPKLALALMWKESKINLENLV